MMSKDTVQIIIAIAMAAVATIGINKMDISELRMEVRDDMRDLRADVSELRGEVSELRGDLSELRGIITSHLSFHSAHTNVVAQADNTDSENEQIE